MAKEKEQPIEAVEPAPKLVDPNTGLEVAPVTDDFDTHVKKLGLGGPCKDC